MKRIDSPVLPGLQWLSSLDWFLVSIKLARIRMIKQAESLKHTVKPEQMETIYEWVEMKTIEI